MNIIENFEPKYLKVKATLNPNGEIREFIDKPECSIGLVTDSNGNVLLVEQWRVGCQSRICEAVGGLVDEGEEPLYAMIRELREETGIDEESIEYIESLDRVYSETGYSTEVCNLFMITLRDGYEHKPQALDEGEDLTYKWYSWDEIQDMFYENDRVLPFKTKYLLDKAGYNLIII